MPALEKRKQAAEPADYQQRVRNRLTELRDRHGLSEIARRTRTPLTNVHRYMREGKIPAEFCAALVDAFEVSPAWLLTGSGGALLSDVDPGTARMGGNLLELVNAMNAVSRMRLGALAGKAQQKTLRELGDALDTYERLREKMNEQTRPLLTELIRRFDEYTRAIQLERAAQVLAAARQVSRFCTDDGLLWRLDQLHAEYEHMCGRVDAGLQIHKKLFARKLHEGEFGDDACQEAAQLALALRDSARFIDALRICEAAIHLAVDAARGGQQWTDLHVIAGNLQLELGEVAAGNARLQAAFRATPPGQRQFASLFLLRGELLAGYRSLHEARATDYPSRPHARLLIRHALMLEDAAEIASLARDHVGDSPDTIPPGEYDGARLVLVERILSGSRADHVASFDKLAAEDPPRVNSPHLREVLTTVHRAQVARLAGGKVAARKATLAAQKAIEAVPPGREVTLELHAVHARNVLQCLGGKAHATLRESSAAWLEGAVKRGFDCLRVLLPGEA